MPLNPAEQYANDVTTTLNGALTAGTTSVTVTSLTGFPTVPSFRIRVDDEIMIVTGPSTIANPLTVTRGAEGTTAASHLTGADVELLLTATALQRVIPMYFDHPRSNNLLAWTGSPYAGSAGSANAAGVLYLHRMWVPETITVANLLVALNTLGSSLTSGQNWGGIYSAAGTLIAKTADQTTAWASVGNKTMALTAEAGQSLTIVGGVDVYVWAALLSNGTSRPVFQQLARDGQVANLGLVATDKYRCGSVTGPFTTMPASVTMTALNLSSIASFVAGLN